MNGVGVPSPPTSVSPVTDVTFPEDTPDGVVGHEDADWLPLRENHGLLLCLSSLPGEGAPGTAARAWWMVCLFQEHPFVCSGGGGGVNIGRLKRLFGGHGLVHQVGKRGGGREAKGFKKSW